MSTRFFGQYLLEKGRITSQQLLDALECQKGVTAPIGVIALERGLLTTEQIKQVLQQQKKTNQRFGEIAVSWDFSRKLKWTRCSRRRKSVTEQS